MSLANVDILNTALIGISFLLALFLPFHLFLFAYAVLGPLHYLTEISWLREKLYFCKRRNDGKILVGASVLLVLLFLFSSFREALSPAIVMFFSFFMALVFLSVKSIKTRTLLLIGIGVMAFILSGYDIYITLFAVFLPTLIHVFLFTGFFMLYGAMKGKSKVGFVNVGILVLLGASFFLLPSVFNYEISTYIRESYLVSFASLHHAITSFFNLGAMNEVRIFSSSLGVSIMQFIAFAYTYHYLNWFSKTKIIKWVESSKPYATSIIGIWIASVALYLYSYEIGLVMLYFLSITHVLLEFPLNHKTIGAVFSEITIGTKKYLTR